jgi:hypothetical protein
VDFRRAAVTGAFKSVNGSGMKLRLTVPVFLCLLAPITTHASPRANPIPIAVVTVCPAMGDTPPVRFDTPQCVQTPTENLDPQGRDLWVRARINLPQIPPAPLGLYVSGKASSEAWVNGVPIGTNGAPATSKAREIPGRMDVAFYISEGLLHAGDNDIVLRLSSFHGTLHLANPMHWIAIAPYDDPLNLLLRAYWPSLVTFGVLLAGGLFFASSALSSVNRRDPLLLSLLSLIAAVQLFAEACRGLVPYAYPAHDWRLLAITGFSAAFGLTLQALIVARFVERRAGIVFAGAALLILAPVFLVPGFDGKATYSLLAAALTSATIAGRAAIKGDRAGMISCLILTVFGGSIVIFPEAFLDRLFYYEVATILLGLFAVRAFTFEQARREHELERLRAHDLELALARVTPPEKTTLRINGAGALTIVNTADITLCKGADDYVELKLVDGRTVLHKGALTDLETELPAGFLRVHRSFIVNTAFVEKLTRETTGVGVLTLSNGAEAPVSRRIMPKVRTALR